MEFWGWVYGMSMGVFTLLGVIYGYNCGQAQRIGEPKIIKHLRGRLRDRRETKRTPKLSPLLAPISPSQLRAHQKKGV